jgi:ribosome-associated protein
VIVIRHNIVIRKEDLIIKAVRSSGPGGQHVNKVSSKIIISCPLHKINGLTDQHLKKINARIGRYINNSAIVVFSQKHRSQYSNKIDAMEKLVNLLQKALKDEKPRKQTKIPKAANEKRLALKQRKSKLKENRKVDWQEGI